MIFSNPKVANPNVATFIEMMNSIAPTITAIATAVLAFFTIVLTYVTNKMAQASSQPFVTVTFEPNSWSMMHCDFVVSNSGNSPAYDISIKVSPYSRKNKTREELPLPFQYITVLSPGKELRSFLSDANDVIGEEKNYRIEVSWKKSPGARLDSVSYDHYIPKGITRLGAESPDIQIAEQIKKIREDWKNVASGQSKVTGGR